MVNIYQEMDNEAERFDSGETDLKNAFISGARGVLEKLSRAWCDGCVEDPERLISRQVIAYVVYDAEEGHMVAHGWVDSSQFYTQADVGLLGSHTVFWRTLVEGVDYPAGMPAPQVDAL